MEGGISREGIKIKRVSVACKMLDQSVYNRERDVEGCIIWYGDMYRWEKER